MNYQPILLETSGAFEAGDVIVVSVLLIIVSLFVAAVLRAKKRKIDEREKDEDETGRRADMLKAEQSERIARARAERERAEREELERAKPKPKPHLTIVEAEAEEKKEKERKAPPTEPPAEAAPRPKLEIAKPEAEVIPFPKPQVEELPSKEEIPEAAPAEEPKPEPIPETKPEKKPEPEEVKVEAPQVEQPKEKPKQKSLKDGLLKTRKGFVRRIFDAIRGKKEIEGGLLGEIEEILFTADIGANTAQSLLESIYEKAEKKSLTDPEKIISLLKQEAMTRVNIPAAPFDTDAHKPFVLMVVGVNGTGKTTTIGKLASFLRAKEKTVLLAAADTFRAAADEQLAVWASRSGCELVRGSEGADPASVVFNALTAAKARGSDVVIADTAGRLHTKFNLMEELKKVDRVVKKVVPDAPHETWLVIDANTGQNAINQAREFKNAVNITGLILTKLDGTAKGGVIIGICDELKIPVRYIGIGEAIEDLRPFDPEAFCDALFEKDEY